MHMNINSRPYRLKFFFEFLLSRYIGMFVMAYLSIPQSLIDFRWLVFCLWIKKGEKLINFSKVSHNFPSCMYKKKSKNFKSSVPVDAVINFNSKKTEFKNPYWFSRKIQKTMNFYRFSFLMGKCTHFQVPLSLSAIIPIRKFIQISALLIIKELFAFFLMV